MRPAWAAFGGAGLHILNKDPWSRWCFSLLCHGLGSLGNHLYQVLFICMHAEILRCEALGVEHQAEVSSNKHACITGICGRKYGNMANSNLRFPPSELQKLI